MLFIKFRRANINKIVEELKKTKIFYIAKLEENKLKLRLF